MPKKTIDAVDVAGKRVLIRVDYNVPLDDSGKITDDRRIRASVPTIKSVISRGGRAILVSHMGRPKGEGFESKYSLSVCAQKLGEILDTAVGFPSQDCTDTAAAEAVGKLGDGQVVLLENLRFHAAEKNGDHAFAGKLAAYADVYVNDAFGAAHREDASMVAVPESLAGKPRVAGLLLAKETRFLAEAVADPKRPFAVVLGGAKVSDKIPAIEHLLPRADDVLIGGAMAYTFLAALGKRVGSSRIEAERMDDAKRILDEAARYKVKLHLPEDHVASTAFAEKEGDVQVFDEHIKDGYMGLDIGPKTQTSYAMILRKAKTVVWNGPMGVFEWGPFSVGTQQVAKAIAKATTEHGAMSIIGGGDSAAAVEKFGLADQFTHVSTGGGASLEMLSGHKFKSVELLDNA